MRIAVIAQPYSVQGKGRGGGAGPEALLRAGVVEPFRARGHEVLEPAAVELTRDEEARYGNWNRVGTANGRLADLVAGARAGGAFVFALCADCNSTLGVLGGLSRGPEPAWPRRVGLIWIDAHADYNTPETSPSGMLGGMPVATARGRCLDRLREQSKLRLPLQAADVVMVGLRDVDPPEAEAITRDGIVTLAAEDLVSGSDRLGWAMRHLSEREDVLYVHVDLDILTPDLAPAAGLPAPGGVSGEQLGAGLGHLLSCPKVGALALASYDAERDADGGTLDQVRRVVSGAAAGLRSTK